MSEHPYAAGTASRAVELEVAQTSLELSIGEERAGLRSDTSRSVSRFRLQEGEARAAGGRGGVGGVVTFGV